jgi:transposase
MRTAEARQQYSWTRWRGGLRLTDLEWAHLELLLPQQASMGRPWKHTLRTILDAILHRWRTGCARSALPDCASPRSTVYDWFRHLTDGGCWSGCTMPCSWRCESTKGARRDRPLASWTARL